MSGLLTIDRWLRDRARITPRRVAIDADGRELTYAELDAASDALAASFLERGLARGDRVATLTANSAEHVAVFFACAKAGLILLPLNRRLAPAELAYQLEDAEPAVLLVEPGLDPPPGVDWQPLGSWGNLPFPRDPLQRSASRTGAAAGGARLRSGSDPNDDDGLLLIYTSGTTGKPKGALLTHANCFWTNLSFDLATGVTGDDVVLQVLPQFHCGGWNVQPLLAWWKGAKVLLERSFDAARCLDLIERKGVTTVMGVPANYLVMAQEPAFGRTDLSSLHRAIVGGAPMPEVLIGTWAERGVEIVQGYGLTEAAPNVLCLPPEDALRRIGSAGKPYPFVEVDLRPDGELAVRGPNVFPGYWRNPEATAEALVDGWLLTGDLAERDEEGFYRIKGRVKDMFVSGGENVYPAEVESVLHEHPAVREAAVIGVPDGRWGEVGVAFVVLDRDVPDDELSAFCRERLARYKVPTSFRRIEALPRSGMNKVVKSELPV